jgi:CRP/FNR family transcriptional regulator, cyclic AMP receptor protein
MCEQAIRQTGLERRAMNPKGPKPALPKSNMLQRFQGRQGRRARVEVLRAHAAILQHGDAIAENVADRATLRELAQGDVLIRQDEADDDLFFVLSGTFRVFVNGREVAERGVGQHLGEMAIIDPSLRRTATVAASGPSVVAKISGREYLALANKHPKIWRATAQELCRRLDARKKFHVTPNETPRVFLGSSRESLPVVEAFKTAIEGVARSRPLELTVTAWSDGVFTASRSAIEALEVQLRLCDFAVLIAGKDDKIRSRGKQKDAPRDNVLFELGLFMGALSRLRTFLLVPRGVDLKIPSDLLGQTPMQFDPNEADLAKALLRPARELVDLVDKNGAK